MSQPPFREIVTAAETRLISGARGWLFLLECGHHAVRARTRQSRTQVFCRCFFCLPKLRRRKGGPRAPR